MCHSHQNREKPMYLLLINPNRFRTPPIPPLGLEYLAGAARRAGHECRILDLCFVKDPATELEHSIADCRPDIAGLTIRNIDSVLYQSNEFFLDDIRPLISLLHGHGVPVVLGGSGFSFIPDEILRFLGGDWGVNGPGETALVRLLDLLQDGSPPPRGTILDGWCEGFDPAAPADRGVDIDYAPYLAGDGIPGFRTQVGCREHCSYCGEGNSSHITRTPAAIAEECAALAGRGFGAFHLCDPEFNQDPAFCRNVLDELARGPRFSWALYLKTSPCDPDLFQRLAAAGADRVTVSVPTGPDSVERAPSVIRWAHEAGLRCAVDLLTGFPGQPRERIRYTIETLRSANPDTVGVNATFRLYPGMAVTRAVFMDPARRARLTGTVERNPDLIRPVFYTEIPLEDLRNMIGDDPRFVIEGFEHTSNYQRLARRPDSTLSPAPDCPGPSTPHHPDAPLSRRQP